MSGTYIRVLSGPRILGEGIAGLTGYPGGSRGWVQEEDVRGEPKHKLILVFPKIHLSNIWRGKHTLHRLYADKPNVHVHCRISSIFHGYEEKSLMNA